MKKLLFVSQTIIKPRAKSQVHHEKFLLGYSKVQMYEIVADINKYAEFLPFCQASKTLKITPAGCTALLVIGYPPLTERYISDVTMKKYCSVRSVCNEGQLFKSLDSKWTFQDGLVNHPKSCLLNYELRFEYSSPLYKAAASLVFDSVAKEMTKAFIKRAHSLYGDPSLNKIRYF